MKLKRRLAFFSVMLVISVFLVSVSSCKGDGLEVDENGNVIDTSWQEKIPYGKTIVAFDISLKYPKKSGSIDVKDWTAVAAYVYGGTIGDNGWGNWPGLRLDEKVDGNPNIFYAEIADEKVGTGTFIFNNAAGVQADETKVSEDFFTIEKGKRYILTSNTTLTEF